MQPAVCAYCFSALSVSHDACAVIAYQGHRLSLARHLNRQRVAASWSALGLGWLWKCFCEASVPTNRPSKT